MEVNKKYLNKTIEDVFSERFGRYSKYIIQERALPDVRDGLKPVQRRILYAMYKDNNVFDKQFRKSAKTVGNVIGNYHPHGDSSVYEAMVRMSQDWKINEKLVIMHGNNGSIDGDNPAAMRYTEAKLSQYANYMLRNIEEKTVKMVPNFDDTELEPSVLPTRVPNLLINGTSGIASGYATEIPPHNMREVIQAAIYLNKNPQATVSELMEYIKAPDFPTGGIIYGVDQIKKAYETGKGKIVVQAKYRIEKNDIIITEIPYDVNKATLLQKIEMLKIDKKIEGINEIIDQSDRTGMEIKISCLANANPELIVNYLLKNTELQKNYNFNMIAIDNKKPQLMGIKAILSSFLKHREDVINKRSTYLLKKAQSRLHIVEGLVLAITNLDEVVKIIRASKDKKDAKSNLIKRFKFSEEQAEAVVIMQLYRLTNTDIASLEKEKEELVNEINKLTKILTNKETLKNTIEKELQKILEENNVERKSSIEEKIVEIKVNKEDLIKEEKNVVVLTKNKYIKRTSLRSYLTAKSNPQLLDGDEIVDIISVTNKEKLIFFFDNGQYSIVPVYDIIENKWKDMGKPLGNLIKSGEKDKVIAVRKFPKNEKFEDKQIISVTEKGYVLKIPLEELDTKKIKSKIKYQALKTDDKVVSIAEIKSNEEVIILTNNDKYNIIQENEIEQMNIKRVGKKIIGLPKNEKLKYINKISKNILLFSKNGSYGFFTKTDLLEDNFRFEKLFSNFKTEPQVMNNILCDVEDKVYLIAGEKHEELSLKKLQYIAKNEKLKKLRLEENIDKIIKEIEIN